MDIRSTIIRDRRIAAGDEAISVAGARVYGRGSHGRAHGSAGVAGDRGAQQISTIVLHQTAGAMIRGDSITSLDSAVASHHRVDRIAAHFVITVDGQAIYVHDVEYVMNNAAGRRGIDIEFCGRYGHGREPGGNRLTRESILAGRQLVTDLVAAIPTIRHIHPHGQVQSTPASHDTEPGPKYHSCCGPDIWVNVGMWAESSLGLITKATAPGYPDHGVSSRQSNAAWRQDI
nr:N-acetylmuramoyl-L-alanine amidase [Nitrosomonas nitrosa]